MYTTRISQDTCANANICGPDTQIFVENIENNVINLIIAYSRFRMHDLVLSMFRCKQDKLNKTSVKKDMNQLDL